MEKEKELIERRIEEISQKNEFLKKLCKDEPEGNLRISTRADGMVRYYQTYKDHASDKMVDKYLSKYTQSTLISRLAQKQYLHTLKPILEQELFTLKKFQRDYHPERKEAVFEELSSERKKLVQPMFLSAEEQFQQWKTQEYKRFEGFPEKLIFETERGEMVRSKSELIIADQLFKEKSHLYYRYEEELHLKKSNQLVHPDFTIMNRYTAGKIYWEHAGMMDNSEYADNFVWKINTYIKEGFIPGKNLIITYETSKLPLDIAVVRKIIKEYF